MTSCGRQFEFHDVIYYYISYGTVTLTIDDLTSFLQLLDVKMYVKVRVSV